MSIMYIYVLQLSHGEIWYVGKTTKTVMKRFAELLPGHANINQLVECFLGDNFDEDKKTKQYWINTA